MIQLENVWRWYPTQRGRKYVLKDISLQIPTGQNVGVIGRNGAGKSTLLRMIGGVDLPNSGSISSNQRISPPFGVASSFSRELSGRDNARFVCRVHGDDDETVRSRMQYIKSFSELGDYFDLPVRSYSTGMRARLSFAISMAFDFDYYLIDELISVGDARFRKKATAAFREKRGKASAVIVSHNMDLIKQECDVGIYLQGGQAFFYDQIQPAIQDYLKAEG